MKTFDPEKADLAQEKYCKDNFVPRFAPSRFNGFRCYSCGQNIYSHGGISVEEAAAGLITGCPYCNYSYCD